MLSDTCNNNETPYPNLNFWLYVDTNFQNAWYV